MSEYQFYEFRAIDKALTSEEMEIIGSWSSRAEPTRRGVTFTYSYGDFPGDSTQVVKEYFDAMFYIANWGTKRLIFKFPSELVNVPEIAVYTNAYLTIEDEQQHVIIELSLEEEEGFGWVEEEEMLDELIALRQDIIDGDYRCLYLSWLKYAVDDVSSEWGELDPDIPEPVVPPGLNDLSDALSKFVAYFEIDKDIIEVAARMSTPLEPKAEIDFSSAIAQLTEDQKNDWLSRLINQEPMLSEKLKRQLSHKEAPKGQTSGRTVQQIADEVADIKQKREALQKQEAAKKELMRMQALEAQKGELWRQVDALIAEKKTKAYDEAIEILISLKSLAIYQDQFTSFKEQVETIKQQHTRLPGLISRLNSAGLTRK